MSIPKAWLVTGSRIFGDRVVVSEHEADRVIFDRDDGSVKIALVQQPIYDEANAVKEFEAWIPSFWNKEKYQDDEGDWLYSDDLVQGALVGWLACAQSRAKSVEVGDE